MAVEFLDQDESDQGYSPEQMGLPTDDSSKEGGGGSTQAPPEKPTPTTYQSGNFPNPDTQEIDSTAAPQGVGDALSKFMTDLMQSVGQGYHSVMAGRAATDPREAPVPGPGGVMGNVAAQDLYGLHMGRNAFTGMGSQDVPETPAGAEGSPFAGPPTPSTDRNSWLSNTAYGKMPTALAGMVNGPDAYNQQQGQGQQPSAAPAQQGQQGDQWARLWGANAASPQAVAAIKNAMDPNGSMSGTQLAMAAPAYAYDKFIQNGHSPQEAAQAADEVNQHQRKEYDLARGLSVSMFDRGNIQGSIDSMNKAMEGPFHQNVHFFQGAGRDIIASVSDMNGDNPSTYHLSPQRFRQFMMSTPGSFDNLATNGAENTLKTMTHNLASLDDYAAQRAQAQFPWASQGSQREALQTKLEGETKDRSNKIETARETNATRQATTAQQVAGRQSVADTAAEARKTSAIIRGSYGEDIQRLKQEAETTRNTDNIKAATSRFAQKLQNDRENQEVRTLGNAMQSTIKAINPRDANDLFDQMEKAGIPLRSMLQGGGAAAATAPKVQGAQAPQVQGAAPPQVGAAQVPAGAKIITAGNRQFIRMGPGRFMDVNTQQMVDGAGNPAQ